MIKIFGNASNIYAGIYSRVVGYRMKNIVTSASRLDTIDLDNVDTVVIIIFTRHDRKNKIHVFILSSNQDE